jgi:cyclopropane fatty-acyl-phospholipid synthase-like methyltransferase
VWGPGVDARDRAIDYIHELIQAELGGTDGPRVLDLGCGVGGSLLYLCARMPGRFVGVTISRVQAELARRFATERGADNVTVTEDDFTSERFFAAHEEHGFDAAFAVESFIHARDLRASLPRLARLVKPGGKVIVVDDMITRNAAGRVPARRERRWLREFNAGWFAHGLGSVDQLVAAARQSGLMLSESRNLTPYLELDRPRDLAARAFISLLRWWPLRTPWFNNLLGGNALQLALKRGLLGYYYLVFTVADSRTSS